MNEEMDAVMKETRQHLDTVAAEIDEVHRRLERLYDALEMGKLELNDLAPRIQALRHQEDQLQAARLDLEDRLVQRKIRLANEEVVRRYVADLRGILANSPLAEQKGFYPQLRERGKSIRRQGSVDLYHTTLPTGDI